MAIALDASSHSRVSGATSLTFAHTCTGSQRALVLSVVGETTDVITGATYNGVAMTLVRKGASGGRYLYAFYLNAPATGANNIVVSASGAAFIEGNAASYTGVSQSGQPEASSVFAGSTGATSFATSVTTVTANAWVVLAALGQAGTITAGSGTTLRATDLVGGILDSGAAIATPGSTTLNHNQASSNAIGGIALSLAPGGSGSISFTEPVDYSGVQRSGTTGTASISGTYTGTPTNVQVRVVNATTGTPVTSYQNATAGGGTFSATVTGIPQGGWYYWQAQFSNDTAVNITGIKHWGVGCFIGAIGQSEIVHADTDGTAVSPNGLLAQYTGSAGTAWSLRSTTGNGLNTIGNAIIAGLGGSVPVWILKYAVGATALIQAADAGNGYWLNTAAGSLYDLFKQGVNSVGGKLEAIIWDQGQQDGYSAAVSQSTYNAGLQTLFSRIRTDFGQSTLPIVVIPLGNYTAASSPITDASWEGVRQAQIEVGQLTSNTLASAMQDIALVDGVHYTSAAFITYGNRVGQAACAAMGLTANARGPAMVSAVKTGSTTVVVNLSQRAGTDFTPSSGITGFLITDANGTATITGAVHTSATKITLTVAAPLSGTVNVKYQYGRAPTVSSPVLDNSTNTLSAMIESGGNLVAGVLATTISYSLKNLDGTPAANLTGLQWAAFDQPLTSNWLAPVAKGNAATTDASGNGSVSIVGTASLTGATMGFAIDNSDGTTATAFKGYHGPIVAA